MEAGSGLNTLSPKWVELLANDDKRFGRRLSFRRAGEVETTTLDQLIRDYGRPLYVKIDVEGHEASVLAGLSSPVPFLSFEVNLPSFLEEGRECVRMLARLEPRGRFNWSRDCQGGWGIPHWQSADEFLGTLAECRDPSVEVFWRSEVAAESTH
jgi:hypothetical protein